VIGKRPHTNSASDLIGWNDATLEVPDDPVSAVGMVRELARDAAFLAAQGRRNALEMCCRNDWRYRILQIYHHFELQPPQALLRELGQLDDRIAELERRSGFQNPVPVQALPL
jgi:hypothetical protein